MIIHIEMITALNNQTAHDAYILHQNNHCSRKIQIPELKDAFGESYQKVAQCLAPLGIGER
jgi:hypothetical protein